MTTLFWLCLFARMHSDQWQSYFLCRGQGPVCFRQNGRKKAWLIDRSRPQKLRQLGWTPPFSPLNSLLFRNSWWWINFEIFRMLCVTHITSRDNYITVRLWRATRCCASLGKRFQEMSLFLPLFLSFLNLSLPLTLLQQRLPPALTRDWRGGGSLSIFLQHHVQQETANWSVKQGYSLQVATGWAYLPLNSLWQVRSQPRGGARHPTERREACGCSSPAS